MDEQASRELPVAGGRSAVEQMFDFYLDGIAVDPPRTGRDLADIGRGLDMIVSDHKWADLVNRKVSSLATAMRDLGFDDQVIYLAVSYAYHINPIDRGATS